MAAPRVDGIASVPLPAFPDGPSPPPLLLDASGRRADGRGCEEFRRTFMQVGVSAAAAGSAYVELGHTKVIAAVHGPRDTGSSGAGAGNTAGGLSGRLVVDFRATPWCGAAGVAASSSAPFGKESNREMAALVASALEPAILFDRFPKSTITLAVHVLSSDGGEAAAAIAAGSLALADAGVPMLDVVAAAGVARLSCSMGAAGAASSTALVLDPTSLESATSAGGGTALIALMPSLDRVTQATLAGAWGPDALEAATGLAGAGAAGLVEVMRGVLRGG